ncbi:MAG: NYN domain-containing protein [bacterium]
MIHLFVFGRVCVFIDVSNVLYSQQTLGWKISYSRLATYLKQECQLVKAIVYTGKFSADIRQLKYLDMLEINGFIVRSKEVKKIKIAEDRYKWKSNLDVELALDMVSMVDQYDTAILLSGDSDFAEPIDRVKALGKRIVVMSTRGRVAKELLDRAKYVDFRRIRADIEK